MSNFPFLSDIIEVIREAKLPENFQWGKDAMEQFEYGKKRSIEAVKEYYEREIL